MSTAKLADRVAAPEAEVARLKVRLEAQQDKPGDWIDKISGSFANDPIYDEAMRLGREWRESQRPKPRKKRRSKNGDS